jgi:vacuolar-type H+-ATPase subunit F/Vma7
MSAVCYIGDEATAAGFRLAGARVLTPHSGEEVAALNAALGDASLVLLSAAFAAQIPSGILASAHAALAPLTSIVPDLSGSVPLPDLAARLRRELGLESSR